MSNTPKVVDREALKEFRKRNDQRYVLEGEYSPNTRVGESDVADNLTPYSEQSGATDTTPFVFQSSGGSSDIGSIAYLKALRGNTVIFNQLVDTINNTTTVNDVVITKNDNGSITITGTASARISDKDIALSSKGFINGHVYLSKFPDGVFGNIRWASISSSSNAHIFTANTTAKNRNLYISLGSGASINVTFYPQLIDLTQMFGAGNEPTTVEEFNRLFPKPYYEYNAGELLSCKVNGYKTVGYNQWDEEWVNENKDISTTTGQLVETSSYYYFRSKNYIKVISGQSYILNRANDTTGYRLFYYDENKNYLGYSSVNLGSATVIPNNCHYVLFRILTNNTYVYENNICFHLTWDGTRTGYKPYETKTYPMPNVELKSAGSVYDELKPDGTLIKRVGSYTFTGSESWASGGATTAGLYRYYIQISDMKAGLGVGGICSKFSVGNPKSTPVVSMTNECVVFGYSNNYLQFLSLTELTTSQVASLFNGVIINYQLATPTESEDLGFQEITPIDDWGTQEFLYDSDISIPVPQGNEFFYPVDYKAFIDSVGGRDDVEYDANQLVSLTQLNNFLKTIAGYDATKTQSLKNVNGTIQWVNEE